MSNLHKQSHKQGMGQSNPLIFNIKSPKTPQTCQKPSFQLIPQTVRRLPKTPEEMLMK